MRFSILALLYIITILCSCSVIRDSPKYELSNGRYRSKLFGNNRNVYVVNQEETIYLYPLKKTALKWELDTTVQAKFVVEKNKATGALQKLSFNQHSFDIDFLTIPFKYRFRLSSFPRQLNATLNGAAYFGYRSDVYSVSYKTNPLGTAARNITHYGFSFGALTGLGATAMNPWVTDNQIGIEYDGLAWSKGIAGIIAINSFTAGVALGWDRLLDNNNKYWIYQNKPWVGFVFGLNLN